MPWHEQGAAFHNTQGVHGQVLHTLHLPQPEAVHPSQQEVAALSSRSSLETPLGGLNPHRLPPEPNVLVLSPVWRVFSFLFCKPLLKGHLLVHLLVAYATLACMSSSCALNLFLLAKHSCLRAFQPDLMFTYLIGFKPKSCCFLVACCTSHQARLVLSLVMVH